MGEYNDNCRDGSGGLYNLSGAQDEIRYIRYMN
jgi:hypothetical protein